MRLNQRLILSILVFAVVSYLFTSDRKKEIHQFISDELKHHPEAHLTDLQKNYFQDAYGPGHLVPDYTRTGNYLSWELKQPEWTDSLLY